MYFNRSFSMLESIIWILLIGESMLAATTDSNAEKPTTTAHAKLDCSGCNAENVEESETEALLQTQIRKRKVETAPPIRVNGLLSESERHLLDGAGGLELLELLEEHTLEELHVEESLSEKQEVSSIDCADEVLLRLGITESLYTPSYDACVEKLTHKTFATGGSGRKLMNPEKKGGSGMSREDVDKKIRERCITRQGHGVALGPRLIRMTFHDAADFNNSQLPNGEDVPLEKTGVDACLRTALLSVGLTNKDDDDSLDDVASGDPNHNRGLNNAVRWVLHMSSASKLSRADMMALGAVTAMEAWMGMSELGFQFGRKNGDCQKIVCNKEDCWDAKTPFFKQPVAEPVGSGMFCPMTNTLDPLRKVMGLSMEELVALQGAHSVGGVIVCSGLGNVANGPFCPKKCGIPPGNFWETGNLDGTSFDDTPGKMDNRYYQLLMHEGYEELPACSEVNKYYPRLSKRGMKNGGKTTGGAGEAGGSGGESKDLSQTCSAGIEYVPENACEVEACAQNCSASEVCLQAQNTENDDAHEFREAWEECLMCKKFCSGSHSQRMAREKFRSELNACRADCKTSAACNLTVNVGWTRLNCIAHCAQETSDCKGKVVGAGNWKTWKQKSCNEKCKHVFQAKSGKCNAKKGKQRRKCLGEARLDRKTCSASCKKKGVAMKECNVGRKTCVTACNDMNKINKQCRRCVKDVCRPSAEALKDSIYNSSEARQRSVRWCKRLTPTRECLDPDVKMPINGGWGDCPEDKRMEVPNTGAGRLTIIQNLERWTKFRGLFKRIMVLPSDWSYLGRQDTKEFFQKFGTDEIHWKNMYRQSWKKVSELGWKDKLRQCSKISCTTMQGNISCPVQEKGFGNAQNKKATQRMQKARKALGLSPFIRPKNLVFEAARCEPPIGDDETCELVGGWGVKAKFDCQGRFSYCTTEAGFAIEKGIKEEWKEGGGQEPTCKADTPSKPSMLATDVAVRAW